VKIKTTYLAILAALVVSAIVVPVAQAGNPTKAELRALEIRGQALDNLCGGVTLVGQAYEAVCGTFGIGGRLTPDQLRALQIRGVAMNQLCGERVLSSDASAALCGSVRTSASRHGSGSGAGVFDWSDFGTGAGAMLGLVLLGGGLAAAARYGRRNAMQSRPAP
jgi:hypothetical protein